MKKRILLPATAILMTFILSGCLENGENLEKAKSEAEKKGYLDTVPDLTKNNQSSSSAAQTNQKQPEKSVEKKASDQTKDDPEWTELAKKFKSAVIKTNFGDIKVKFYGNESPKTAGNFLKLAREKFYDGTKFHRVIPNFMIQGGDPNSKDSNWSDDGQGGPGYAFADELNSQKIRRGSIAMANSGPGTNGSQFFIVTKEATPWLDGKHTNFGEVVSGMEEVVMKIDAVKTTGDKGSPPDHPTEDVIVKSIELLEK